MTDFVSAIPVITTDIFQDNINGRNNENLLRSQFAATSFPLNPVIGQKCFRSDINIEYTYNGTIWQDVDANTVSSKDINIAIGTKPTLHDRLSVSINDDGTLKTPATANVSEWVDPGFTYTFISGTQFSVPTNQIDIYSTNRAIKATVNATVVYSFVVSSVYDGTTKTTVTLADSLLVSPITNVQHGMIKYSADARGIKNTPTGGIVSTDVQSAINELDTKKLATTGNAETASATGNLKAWKASTTYVLGDICYSAALPSYARAECTVAGISGTVEPTWPAVGSTVVDGSATWKIRSILDSDTQAGRAILPVPVRQTVLGGPVDTNGQAAQLQIGTGLAVNELAGTSPKLTTTTWANGFDGQGAVDYVQQLTADVVGAWPGLTASSTLYLYKVRDISTGAITYGFTTLAPIYQGYAPSTPATNQYWFDTVNMVGQYWSGSAWVICQWCFIGECVTGASTVTSVTASAYKGKYDSGLFAVGSSNAYIKNHNLGIQKNMIYLTLADDIAGTNERICGSYFVYSTNGYYCYPQGTTRNQLTLMTGINIGMNLSGNVLTSGFYRLKVMRGW